MGRAPRAAAQSQKRWGCFSAHELGPSRAFTGQQRRLRPARGSLGCCPINRTSTQKRAAGFALPSSTHALFVYCFRPLCCGSWSSGAQVCQQGCCFSQGQCMPVSFSFFAVCLAARCSLAAFRARVRQESVSDSVNVKGETGWRHRRATSGDKHDRPSASSHFRCCRCIVPSTLRVASRVRTAQFETSHPTAGAASSLTAELPGRLDRRSRRPTRPPPVYENSRVSLVEGEQNGRLLPEPAEPPGRGTSELGVRVASSEWAYAAAPVHHRLRSCTNTVIDYHDTASH